MTEFNSFQVGKCDLIGTLHFEDGYAIVGDAPVDEMIRKMVGGAGARLTGVLHVSFDIIPSQVTGADSAFGGPYEGSEP